MRFGKLIAAAILFSIAGLQGCTSWKSVPNGIDPDGYDVYRPEPYLLIVQGSITQETQQPANQGGGDGKTTTDSGNAGRSLLDATASVGAGAVVGSVIGGAAGGAAGAALAASTSVVKAEDTAVPPILPNRATPAGDHSNGESPTTQSVPQFSAQIVWLPDYSQRYRISGQPSFGQPTILFKDGWELASITDANGAGAMASALLSSAASVGTAALGSGAKPSGAAGAAKPQAMDTTQIEQNVKADDADTEKYRKSLLDKGKVSDPLTADQLNEKVLEYREDKQRQRVQEAIAAGAAAAAQPPIDSFFGLYKIVFGKDGHAVGLVKLEPENPTPKSTVSMNDHRPPKAMDTAKPTAAP